MVCGMALLSLLRPDDRTKCSRKAGIMFSLGDEAGYIKRGSTQRVLDDAMEEVV